LSIWGGQRVDGKSGRWLSVFIHWLKKRLKAMRVRLAGSPRISSDALCALARWIAACAGIFLLTIAQAPGQQPFMTIEGDLKTSAWWVIADFHPFTTEVRGIPVKQIRKSWCKATEFRKDLFPKELLSDGGGDAMEAGRMSFAIEGHFDGSAANQVALVGVYQECSGQKGRFILILDQPASGKARIRFVSATPTDRQFGALEKEKDNSIVAWVCMDCDGFSVLKWDRTKRKFDWLPEPEQE
jgi:hypothetical protein